MRSLFGTFSRGGSSTSCEPCSRSKLLVFSLLPWVQASRYESHRSLVMAQTCVGLEQHVNQENTPCSFIQSRELLTVAHSLTNAAWHSQLDDSIGNTPTTVSWRVWGYEVGLGWRLASSGISLPNNVFSWLLSDFTGPFSRPKNPSKRVHHKGPPLLALRLVRMQQVST